MRKFGLFFAGGATVAAVVVMYMPVGAADPHSTCSAGSTSTACYRLGLPGPVNQYPPITPGELPPALTGPMNQYPPETPGARPPGLTAPVNQYPPETPGARPPGVAGPGANGDATGGNAATAGGSGLAGASSAGGAGGNGGT
jgi:hypothetical protein